MNLSPTSRNGKVCYLILMVKLIQAMALLNQIANLNPVSRPLLENNFRPYGQRISPINPILDGSLCCGQLWRHYHPATKIICRESKLPNRHQLFKVLQRLNLANSSHPWLK